MEDQPGPTAPAVEGRVQPPIGAQPDAKMHAPNDLSAEQGPVQPFVELAPIEDVSPTAALVVTPVIRQLQEVRSDRPLLASGREHCPQL